jgi:hypothetical protein
MSTMVLAIAASHGAGQGASPVLAAVRIHSCTSTRAQPLATILLLALWHKTGEKAHGRTMLAAWVSRFLNSYLTYHVSLVAWNLLTGSY